MATELVVNQRIAYPPSSTPHRKPSSSSSLPTEYANAYIEIRVIYVRIISPRHELWNSSTSSSMEITFPRRSSGTLLRVNGVAVSPDRDVAMAMNKHEAPGREAGGAGSVYVNTNSVAVSAPAGAAAAAAARLPFGMGAVRKDGSCSPSLVVGELRREGESKNEYCWVMECRGGGGRRGTTRGGSGRGMLVDVCLAGRMMGGSGSGRPLLLSCVVEVGRWWVHEAGEDAIVKILEEELMKGSRNALANISGYKCKEEELIYEEEEEEGGVSWFKAGLRVGMGLGLGMSLGVGVGVGLAIRSYQAAAGVLKRLL